VLDWQSGGLPRGWMAGFLHQPPQMPASRPLTILHIAAPAVAGGLESILLDLAGGLARSGHRAVLATVLDPGTEQHPVPGRAAELGVEVVRVVVPPRSYLREYRGLRRAIESVRPDLVHTHGYRADLLGGLAARHAGLPWVSTAHGFTGGDRKNRAYEWLQVRAYRSAQAVVAVSRPIQHRLARAGVPADRIQVLPNAWTPKPLLGRDEARSRLGIPADEYVVGWVGRLTHEKGADVFLEALSRAGDLPWRASILGDGRDRNRLEARARALGIGDRVRWHGPVFGAAAFFSAFDAFVLSSRTEGTPVALMEAVAAHVPVVSTAVGGVPDMFSGAEIILVPSERPEAIAAGLRGIAEDPTAARRRSGAAFDGLAARFSLGDWLASHLALYATCVSNGTG